MRFQPVSYLPRLSRQPSGFALLPRVLLAVLPPLSPPAVLLAVLPPLPPPAVLIAVLPPLSPRSSGDAIEANRKNVLGDIKRAIRIIGLRPVVLNRCICAG